MKRYKPKCGWWNTFFTLACLFSGVISYVKGDYNLSNYLLLLAIINLVWDISER